MEESQPISQSGCEKYWSQLHSVMPLVAQSQMRYLRSLAERQRAHHLQQWKGGMVDEPFANTTQQEFLMVYLEKGKYTAAHQRKKWSVAAA